MSFTKQRLVIIGNGMAGARLIEEILARYGKERYEIVIFGEEPYGSYNRILLSSVLAGIHDPEDIFINPLAWYQKNDVRLFAGNRVHTIDCAQKLVYAHDGTVMPYDKLVLATGSSPAIPALNNLHQDNGQLKTGVFVLRNCAEATTKDLGAVAIEGDKWEVYIGGAAGSRVRKGDVLCIVDTHEDVLLYMGRFMQYYREKAKYLERTYDFVERVGIERLRQILVEDSEDMCARLDQEIQAAVDAYVDPWLKEAHIPVTPAQFATTLKPLGTV
jgi:NAD(P)H-nitrite reductase large subunit